MSPMSARFDPLAALAADRAGAGPESTTCSAVAFLLAVPAGALNAADRAQLDEHLVRCPRCRAVALETWLDGDLTPPQVVAPVRPTPPSRRPDRRWWSIGPGVAALAALAAFAFWITSFQAGAPRPDPGVSPPAPSPAPAIVIAFPGNEYWMGNASYVDPVPPPHDPAKPYVIHKVSPGYQRGLGRALDELAAALPSDAQVGLLAFYDGGREVVRPLSRVQGLGAADLQDPVHYRGRIGWGDYLGTLDEAVAMLRAVPASRRIVIAVAPDCLYPGQVSPMIAARRRAEAAGVELRFLEASLWDAECDIPLVQVDPTRVTVNQDDGFARALHAIVIDGQP